MLVFQLVFCIWDRVAFEYFGDLDLQVVFGLFSLFCPLLLKVKK